MTGGAVAQPQQVDISKLPLENLVMLKNQFEQETQGLAQAVGTLRVAGGRFQSSAKALEILQTSEPGAEVLVPLTGSLYTPGCLLNPSKALVDVGTGFFIEKSTPDALDFCKRKLSLILEKASEAETELGRKRENVATLQHLINVRKQQGPAPIGSS